MDPHPERDDVALARDAWWIPRRGETVTDPALAAEVIAAARTIRLNNQPSRFFRVFVVVARVELVVFALFALAGLARGLVRDGLLALAVTAAMAAMLELPRAKRFRLLRNAARSEASARALLAG